MKKMLRLIAIFSRWDCSGILEAVVS